MEQIIHLKSIFNSIFFSLLGLVILAIGYFVFEKVTPGNFWKEILEEHNIALAIVVAAVILGTSIIIAVSVAG